MAGEFLRLAAMTASAREADEAAMAMLGAGEQDGSVLPTNAGEGAALRWKVTPSGPYSFPIWESWSESVAAADARRELETCERRLTWVEKA